MKSASYTKPELRERIKSRVMAGSDGGKPGQWSARKAQLVAQKYEASGGGYSGKKTEAQKSLSKWTDQKWTTSDGKPAERKGGTTRYLPEKAWDKLSPSERAATNAKKREGSREGEQFVKNTEAAAEARKEAMYTYLEKDAFSLSDTLSRARQAMSGVFSRGRGGNVTQEMRQVFPSSLPTITQPVHVPATPLPAAPHVPSAPRPLPPAINPSAQPFAATTGAARQRVAEVPMMPKELMGAPEGFLKGMTSVPRASQRGAGGIGDLLHQDPRMAALMKRDPMINKFMTSASPQERDALAYVLQQQHGGAIQNQFQVRQAMRSPLYTGAAQYLKTGQYRFRKVASEGGAWQRSEGKNPEGGLNAKGRASLRAQGHDIKPGVKGPANTPEKMKRKGSFLSRMFGPGAPGSMKKDNGEPSRRALSAKAWGEPVPQDDAGRARLYAKGQALLKRYEGKKEAMYAFNTYGKYANAAPASMAQRVGRYLAGNNMDQYINRTGRLLYGGAGAIGGGTLGAVGGAIRGYSQAPEGEGFSGALKGGLAGGAVGATVGGTAGALAGNRLARSSLAHSARRAREGGMSAQAAGGAINQSLRDSREAFRQGNLRQGFFGGGAKPPGATAAAAAATAAPINWHPYDAALHGKGPGKVYEALKNSPEASLYGAHLNEFMQNVGQAGANPERLQHLMGQVPKDAQTHQVMNVLYNKHHGTKLGSLKLASYIETCLNFGVYEPFFNLRF